MILVDSSTYITLLRKGRNPAVEICGYWQTLDIFTCGMVQVEVLRGIREPGIRQKMEAFYSICLDIPTNNRLWEKATQIAWELDGGEKFCRRPIFSSLPAPSQPVAKSLPWTRIFRKSPRSDSLRFRRLGFEVHSG